MRLIITAENLGKQYRLGTQQAAYATLRETIANAVRRPDKTRNGNATGTFWALRDINFEIQEGEVVGIIGRNGAGKSTLLRILSRVTEPTTGRVKLRGRVGSLLEVGTGFHPELTGRENIFLNGAILGMKKAEIVRKFDEIVAFAEIEKFIDTPVKRYSTGMYLRLAFAVAAHLEPDVLLVDEVLAVGDASFQRKCLDKMKVVGEDGRTVLFVSHNMPAVTRLCERIILLDEGRVVADGPAHKVASLYLQSGLGTMAVREWKDRTKAPGNEIVRLCAVRVINEDGEMAETIDIRRPVGIEMEFEVLQAGRNLVPNYTFTNEEGVCVFVAIDHDPQWYGRTRDPGHYISTAWIDGNFLAEGTLIVGAAMSTMDPVLVHFHEREAVAFQIVDSLDGGSARGDFAGTIPGVVRPMLKWTTSFDSRQSNAEVWSVREGA
jgi:lipopolysaccharide transport system ATP-binding protein